MSTESNPTKKKKITPYDANYQFKLAQAGVFLTPEVDENDAFVPPANYHDLLDRLNRPRRSLSPSRFTEHDYQRFTRQTERAIAEAGVMPKSMQVIEGGGGHIYSGQIFEFDNLKPFDPDLAVAVPGYYDGAPPLSIDHRILTHLSDHIVPCKDMSRPALPNFFLEGKSSQGRADVARRQAAHVGAIGARGMMRLQSYPSRAPQYDREAHSFTSTYCNGYLEIYVCHATAPTASGQPPQYHMTPLRKFAMTDCSKTFREGATCYRNARDLAHEQRHAFIQRANQVVQQNPPSKPSSTDELAPDRAYKRSRQVTFDHDHDHIDNDGDTDMTGGSVSSGPSLITTHVPPTSPAPHTTRIALAHPLPDKAGRMHFRSSSTQTATPDLTNIVTIRFRQDGIMRRAFVTRRRLVHTPDAEWQHIMLDGCDAWVHWERRLYCVED